MGDFAAMPGHLIRRLNQISMGIFAAQCAASGLTSVQYAALTAIGQNPGVDATRLSSLIAFDRSTLGDVLERLEGKGWILRAASPQDKRLKILRLSAAGGQILQSVEADVLRVQQILLEPLDGHDRAEMMRLLTELVRRHEQATA